MADKVAASIAPPHPDKVAASKEIRSAYKRLALQLHPDKVAASEEADAAALITVASRPRRLHNSPSPRPTSKGSSMADKVAASPAPPHPDKVAVGKEIRSAYRCLALQLHPDKVAVSREADAATAAFQELVHAHEVLSDPKERAWAISMDCDDSDFQSQNFQLIGEDNDGFPQSLQSYDPPKFEIDDHFQSHLRFDSLSETGLFLGIQGEENNWIDEFSPRNSAVGLDSSVSNTCSLSGRDIIWSNAPPSENAQILNSVGDGEINPQVMNTEAETEAKEDSGKSETKSSNVSAEQHGVSPDTPLVKKSDVVFEVSSLDQKFHSSEEVIALQCTVNEELSSSSGDVSKACLATGQPPDMVQSKEPIDISSTRNSSLDDCGCSLNKGSDVTSNLISCSTRDDPSPDNTGSGNGKLDNPLSRDQERKECFEVDRSQALQSENKQGETTYNLYDDCQQSDHHCHDQTNDNPDCVAKVSSELGPPLDSLMLANEESSNSMFSKNSDGLLEAIAYQVKGFNNDLKTGGEISTCSDKLPSFTVEGDRGIVVGINSVQVGTDTRSGHCDLEGTIVFSHGAQEYISIDDGLKQRESLTVESQAIYIDEESGFASSKAGDSDNNCSELCSSGSAGKTELSSLGKCETRMAVVEGDNGCRNDPSSSNYFTPAKAEESAEDESLGAITKKPTELGATGHTILKEPRADLLDNVDNLKSSSVHDDLAPISDTSSMFAKLNEGSQNHLEEKDSTGELVDSSGAMSKDCSNVIENTEFSSFKTPKNVSTITDQKSMIDEAVADHALEGTKLPSSNNSTNTQQLQSVSEVIEEDKEVALSSVPDSQPNEENAHISLLPIKISDQPVEAPDSDANVQAFHNLSYGLETAKSDEVQVSSPAQLSSLATCQSTKGENANLAPTINSNKLRCPETEINTLSSSADKLGQPGLPESNLDSCMLDPQGGNISPSEPNCGSPTVISGKECTVEMRQRENNSSLKDPAGPEITERSDRLKNVVQDSKVSSTSEGEQGFSFAVQPDIDTSKKDMNGDLEPLSKMQSLELPQENSQGHSTKTINQTTSIISKSVEGKKKQASARATRKAGISKGDVKEKSIEKQCKGRKITPLSTSTGLGRATRSKTDTTGVQQRLFVETGTSKAFCSQSIQTSNLPDLNTSAPLIFHQPFTDLQQVQLRAQIFVYGSLIQGVLPDEACMLPAFGGADGGRSVWEQAWRVASERLLNQKTPPSSSGTHLHYHSEQGITCSPLQSKTLNSSVGWKDGKVPVSATQSNMSLQSSFQSSSSEGLPSAISRGTHFESNQFPSPLLPYQTSQTRQYLTNSSPWLSPSPHHAPWGFSSQNSPFDSTSRYSAIAPTEITQAAPVRSSSKPSTTNLQLASTVSLLANQGAVNVSAALVASLETQNKAATPASVKNASVSDKSKKRKKISVSEELVPNIFVSKPQGEPTSSTFIDNTLSRSACLSLPSNSLTAAMSAGLVSSTSHATTMPYYQTLGGSNPHPGVFSKETCTHIEHSKLQADTASAYASAAVRHSQVIWEQMTAAQRKIGFTSEFEEKLASAAVAAAAAASVAKAAAEVAKVASEAALQAKLMADEALSSSYCENITQNSESSLDLGKTLLASTPVSIPRVKDKISGPLIISAARETTRKRVEAATAAIKRAENLDAVLKAAEMVAEAVSHVGMVVSMGDPLPFSITELVEVGPGDHWKLHHKILKNGTETNDQAKENLDLYVAGDHEIVRKQSSELPAKHDERRKVSVEISHNNQKSIFTQEINQAHDLENGSNAIPTDTPVRDPIQASSIETGSVVEVLADVEGLRGAWFSAFVLDVKDGKAYVCYNHLYNKDHDNLKEWVPLESESTQPPRIRVAHRVMSTIPEGTRKRRREAIGNFNWAVGDRVDVWMRDGWWEGVIIEKDKDDETKLTVRFPVGGDSSIVRAWNVRLSLIWKDGQWIEWSRFTESTLQTYEGDTPHEKRQKLGRLDAKSKFEIGEEGLGNVPRNFHASNVRKLEETKPLNLSAKDAIFSTGKNASEGSNNDTFKVRRAGLQKDGSKVVYGVPKPGKKRKFMEVSKHYTTDKTEKETETGDSIKFAKYLIPQASRLWRNSSKVDVKGKPTTNMNTRGAKSLRFQNVQAKTTVDKDKSFGTASVSNGIESSLKTSFSTEEKSSLETDSFHDVIGKVDVAVIESSLQPVSGLPTSKKFSVEHATVEKEKVLSAVDQLSRSEIQGAENSGTISADVIEPRRSNRRIQPTSRLLEGLQSSLIISKTPNATHDRGPKTFHKGLSTSRGQSHG